MSDSRNQAFGQQTATDTVRIERVLPGPIERVWRYLTDAELRGKWLATGPMALQAGGAAELVFHNRRLADADDAPPAKYTQHNEESRLVCHVIDCDPPHRLSMTWGDTREVPSEVSFDLSTIADRVLLVVTHRRLPSRDMMLSVSAGWHAHVGILIALLEERQPESFWRTHTKLEAEYDRRFAG